MQMGTNISLGRARWTIDDANIFSGEPSRPSASIVLLITRLLRLMLVTVLSDKFICLAKARSARHAACRT
jgi:hypothetical protein